MIDFKMFNMIENQCRKIKNTSTNCVSFFEKISVIIFINDFYQFFLFKNIFLWMSANSTKSAEISDKTIWKKFNDVIMLTEQQKQSNDFNYTALFQKIRNENFQIENAKKLNARVTTKINNCKFESCSVIVKLNEFRHRININQMKKFAAKRNQKIYVFCVDHFRRSVSDFARFNDLLKIQNKSDVSFSNFLFYIKKMSCMFFTNVNIVFHHVNDAKKILIDVFQNQNN